MGGDPDQFGTSLTAFHRHNAERARDWPATMLGSSTHDTKRSEDVRARINVLSELPREWRTALDNALARAARALMRLWRRDADARRLRQRLIALER